MIVFLAEVGGPVRHVEHRKHQRKQKPEHEHNGIDI